MLSRWHPYASISSCNRDIFQKYGRNTETCSVSICTREKADKYYHVLIYFSAFSHLLYKTLIHLGVTFREISISKCSLIFSFPAVLFFISFSLIILICYEARNHFSLIFTYLLLDVTRLIFLLRFWP